MAAGFVRSGVFRRVMIVGAEKLSGIINQEDRATAILFGDGAGAAIVERADERLVSWAASSAPTARIPNCSTSRPAARASRSTSPRSQAGEQYVQMLGREIFKYAVTRMVDSARDRARARAT